jgi:hypothetical protein
MYKDFEGVWQGTGQNSPESATVKIYKNSSNFFFKFCAKVPSISPIAFVGSFLRFCPLVLPVRVVLKWSWVWDVRGLILRRWEVKPGFIYRLYERYGQGRLSQYSDSLRSGRSGDRISVGHEIFRTHTDRPWGSPSLPHNGYRVFPGGEATGGWRWPPTPSSAEVK